jgi:hypothetical protein
MPDYISDVKPRPFVYYHRVALIRGTGLASAISLSTARNVTEYSVLRNVCIRKQGHG